MTPQLNMTGEKMTYPSSLFNLLEVHMIKVVDRTNGLLVWIDLIDSEFPQLTISNLERKGFDCNRYEFQMEVL